MSVILIVIVAIRAWVIKPFEILLFGLHRFKNGDYSHRIGPIVGIKGIVDLSRQLDELMSRMHKELITCEDNRKLLEAALAQANAASVAKGRFLANMSHEIRNPMNAIVGMVYLVLDTQLTVKQQNYLYEIDIAAKLLLGILNDILDFSKIEAGKLTIENKPMVVEQVVNNTIAVVRQQARAKGIELLVVVIGTWETFFGVELLGDSMRLGQVLANLLSNAIKFTHVGHVRLIVNGENQTVDSVSLQFTVEDTGIGMTTAQVAGLFKEFNQTDSSIACKYGGTGLGLAISKHLVELMGGQIWAESSPQQGAAFHFTIKLSYAQSEHRQITVDPTIDLSRLHALVVDDHPTARKTTVALLQHVQISQVDACADGKDAVKLINEAVQRNNPYDLLLLDWVMPSWDGRTTLHELVKQAIPLPNNIIVVSGYDISNIQAQATGFNIRSFLAKPLLPKMLWDTLTSRNEVVASPPIAKFIGERLVGMRVLLVEDNKTNQQLAIELLRQRGVMVDTADNGQEAIEQIKSRAFNYYALVLMDLQMPILDGYETTKILRAEPKYADLPIVAISAYALVEERQRGMDMGMNGYLTKPFDPKELFALLAKYYQNLNIATDGVVGGFHNILTTSQTVTDDSADLSNGGLYAYNADDYNITHSQLPSISGLNTQHGLMHCDGDVGLYLTLLQSFYNEYHDSVANLQLALENRNWSDAGRIAHTLKGLANTLGMDGVAPVAEALERATQAQDLCTFGMLPTLLGTLGPILDALSTMPNVNPASPIPQATDEVATAACLHNIRNLLAEADTEALDLWNSHYNTLINILPYDTARQINHALDCFDFEKALTLLNWEGVG